MVASENAVLSTLLAAAQAAGERVVVKDPEAVQLKLESFIDAGPRRLQVTIKKKKTENTCGRDVCCTQVVTDFDRTITRCFDDHGKMVSSSHGAIETSSHMGPEFGKILHNYFLEYYPKEIDHTCTRPPQCTHTQKKKETNARITVSHEVREKFMTEWWTKTHDLFLQKGMRRDDVAAMVAESNLQLRRGVPELFAVLRDNKIPVLVFSAGVANVVEAFLGQNGLMTSNAHVVSNKMVFDDAGVICGFEGELIHSLNKNGTALRNNKAGWAHDSSRTHALVLGDNTSDTQMVAGLEHDQVLSIGFLNDKVNERLDIYKDQFDIVILNDGSMSLVKHFIDIILKSVV